MATFGNTNTGNQGYYINGFNYGSVFTAPASGTLTKITARMWRSSSSSVTVTAGIFNADTTAAPLATKSMAMGSFSEQWIDFVLDTPISIVGGTNYLLFTHAPSGDVAQKGNTGSGKNRYTGSSPATVYPTSWSNDSITYSIYATYDIPSGPANLKTYNTNLKANIKTINTNPIANVKSLNTNV